MHRVLLSPKGQPITYHNVQETAADRHGLTFYRVPKAWLPRFPEVTASRAIQAAGVELRFYAATRHISLDVRIENYPGYSAAFALYHGYRNAGLATLPVPRYSGKVLLMDRQEDIDGVLDEPWRIICPYGALTTIKTLYLSDSAELLPADGRTVRWLAHGDSITQGAHALSPGMTYVNLVADELGWDAINLGFGGSAWGDAVIAEYIAARSDWDVLSLAIGINTYSSATESAADFGTTYDRFLSILREVHPDKPVLCITPIWYREDAHEVQNRFGDTPQAYREAISRVVRRRAKDDPNLALLDGLSLIGTDRGLTVDRVHPDVHGTVRMAAGIADALRKMF